MAWERSNTKREKPTQPDAININRNSSINFRQTPATSKFPRWPIFSIPIAAYTLRIHCRLMCLLPMCFCSVRTSAASLVVVVLILHRRVSHCFDLFWCPLRWCRAYELDRPEYKYPVERTVDTLVRLGRAWDVGSSRSVWYMSIHTFNAGSICKQLRSWTRPNATKEMCRYQLLFYIWCNSCG